MVVVALSVMARAAELSLPLVNSFALVSIFFLCIGAAATTLAEHPYRLWFPITWFLLTSAVYYGFGPLLYYFGNSDTVQTADNYYPINDAELFSANLLTLLGICTTLLTYIVVKQRFGKGTIYPSDVSTSQYPSHRLKLLSTVFIAIGAPIKLLFVLPRALGLWDITLPGSFETLASLSLLAIVPLLELRRRPKDKLLATILLTGLILLEMTTAFVTLSKHAILKVAIATTLAWVLRKTSFRAMAAAALLVVISYSFVLSPMITYGRNTFGALGLTKKADIQILIQDMLNGTAGDELSNVYSSEQGWWARLNYANAQAFAMNAYIAGQPGDTLLLAAWTFVPRVLYPDKPIMTSGSEFNEKVNGNPNSLSAPGIIAEGYWNGGIAGTILVTVLLGLFLARWESYTANHLAKGNLHLLPVMWMGLFPAIQQDSWFVPSTLGMLTIAIAYHWFARLTFQR